MYDYEKLLIDFSQIKPGSKVLVRADLNLTISGNDIASSLRIDRTVPLIKQLLKKGAHITLVTHLGRPNVGFNDIYSTRQLVPVLEKIIKKPIIFNNNWPYCKKLDMTNAVILAENVRFLQGEVRNNPELAKEMASGYDFFVMEAFASAHRMHASTYGVMNHCKSFIGPLFLRELQALQTIKSFKKPKVAIIGGGKSSSKLEFVKKLVHDFDSVLLGGQMASLFMAAEGYFIGDVNFDQELLTQAKEIYLMSQKPEYADLIMPKDLWVSSNDSLSLKTTPLSRAEGLNIVDIGPLTTRHFDGIIKEADSVLQNGPMGIIENSRCFEGTRAILNSIADSRATSILGGGDTSESIRRAGINIGKYNFVSTGGGAMLYGVAHDEFPAVERLKACLCQE